MNAPTGGGVRVLGVSAWFKARRQHLIHRKSGPPSYTRTPKNRRWEQAPTLRAPRGTPTTGEG